MSICDTCKAPGACCKKLQLIENGNQMTFWKEEDALKYLEDKKLPFKILRKTATYHDEESGNDYYTYEYMCPVLLPNGRCGDYENRPDLCRNYEPKSDKLCVHYGEP